MAGESKNSDLILQQARTSLAAEVAAGAAVVLLCEGDASLYASCSYVLLALAERHPHCPVRVVPGPKGFGLVQVTLVMGSHWVQASASSRAFQTISGGKGKRCTTLACLAVAR